MSAIIPTQQLQTDLQNELTTTNQLLRQISLELQKIKAITKSGGELDTTVKQNAILVADIAKLQKVNLTDVPLMRNIELPVNRTRNLDESME